ncbi:MAG: hypothetical protein GXP62_20860, partial [Oligoflexia bacterium]|nr:hypothetical protein [Oligoflexia bacterium]
MPASPPTASRADRAIKRDPHIDADLAPDLVVPEISNRLVYALLLGWEREHGPQAIAALVEGAGLPRAYLQDPQRFVSASYVEGLARTWARQHYHLRELPDHDHPLFAAWQAIGQQSWDGRGGGGGGALLSLIR